MNLSKKNRKIEIRTGSDSDISHISKLIELLKEANISYSQRILSAHRTPDIMMKEAKKLEKKGFVLSIAAAGGSAHLPGMTASETILPVIAIPVLTKNFNGMDSLLSSLQMPEGVPLGVVPIDDSVSTFYFVEKIIKYIVKDEVRKKEDEKINDKILLLVEDRVEKQNDSMKKIIEIKEELERKIKIKYELELYNRENFLKEINKFNNEHDIKYNDYSNIILFEYVSEDLISKKISKKIKPPLLCSLIIDKNEMINFDLIFKIFTKDNEYYSMVFTGINRIQNAFLYSLKILAIKNKNIYNYLKNFVKEMKKSVIKKDKSLKL